ncbi:MAG: hypothetical protein LBU89_12670 [Fibromonadaceae bacterium]|nr:hypothetical protein [Fibromonadaceae bacterium]
MPLIPANEAQRFACPMSQATKFYMPLIPSEENSHSQKKQEIPMKNGTIKTMVAVLLFAASMAVAQFSSGAGEENDPYIITSPEQLDEVRNHLNSHFELDRDCMSTPKL